MAFLLVPMSCLAACVVLPKPKPAPAPPPGSGEVDLTGWISDDEMAHYATGAGAALGAFAVAWVIRFIKRKKT